MILTHCKNKIKYVLATLLSDDLTIISLLSVLCTKHVSMIVSMMRNFFQSNNMTFQ